MDKKYLIIGLMLTSLLLIQVIVASEDIRPINQIPSRGVGEMYRPANQMNEPSTGNNDYVPEHGSKYCSKKCKEETEPTPTPEPTITPEPTPSPSPSPTVNPTPTPTESNLVNLEAVLSPQTESNRTSGANGTGSFVLDKQNKTLSYNIEYQGLSSNETSASIDADIDNSTQVLFVLPIGNLKIGVFSFNETVQPYILNGNSFVKISSLLFPNGELKGTINII